MKSCYLVFPSFFSIFSFSILCSDFIVLDKFSFFVRSYFTHVLYEALCIPHCLID